VSLAWIDGTIVEGPIAIDPADRGLALGDGLFETLCVLGGVALWQGDHLDRMEQAAAELAIPLARAALEAAVAALCARSSGGAEVLRLTLTRGVTARGLAADGAAPHLIATLAPLARVSFFRPLTLAVASIRRNGWAPSSRLKTLSYADNVMAARQAADANADDALCLNTSGHVASTTVANVFAVIGEELVTPAPGQAILPGIMRKAVLALAPAIGLRPVERPVELAEVATAEAVFVTNSLRLAAPVTHLDGRPLGRRRLDHLTGAIAEEIRAQSGRDPRLI
jgi:branched-chain amino acid aminotransferase